jgi:hypothetical protein
MRTLVLITVIAILASCNSPNGSEQANSEEADCNVFDSTNIEEMDTCLVGMTIKQAIDKLDLDTSQFHAFDEPPGILRGIKFMLNDDYEIELSVERTSIINQSTFTYREHYRYIEDKIITAVSWTNLKSGKRHREIQ